jgi:glycerol-3-phosphate cytidylyltransferase-like family protein
MISALRYVDDVVPYGDIDESIKGIDFDVFVVGGDQLHTGFQRAITWCEANGKQVYRLSRTEGISASQIRAGIK